MPKSDDPKSDDSKSSSAASSGGGAASQGGQGGGQSGSQSPGGASKGGSANSGAPDAINLLRQEHREAEQLFERFRTAGAREKEDIVRKLCKALTQHMILEEELFYPACEPSNGDGIDESQVQHDAAKLMVAELYALDGADPYLDAKVKVLAEEIRHHVQEEEQPQNGVFAKAQKAGVNTPELGRRLAQRKQDLQDAQELWPLRPVTFHAVQVQRGPRQESSMQQRYGSPPRDEYGRFVSEYDDQERGEGRHRGYGAASGGRNRGYGAEEEDDYGRYGGMSQQRYGQERGGFGGREDDDGRRYGAYGGYQGGGYGQSSNRQSGYGQSGYSQGGYSQGGYSQGGYGQGAGRRFSSRYSGEGRYFGEGYGGGGRSGYGGREDEDEYRGRSGYSGRERESRGYGRGYEDEDEGRGYMRR